MLKKQWLSWLPHDVNKVQKMGKNLKKSLYNFEELFRQNEKTFFNSVLIFW